MSEFAALEEQNLRALKIEAQRTALLEERAKYERSGKTDYIPAVDEALERLGPRMPVVDVAEFRRQAQAEADRKTRTAALIEERRGYQARGLADRVALVDAELARIDADAAGPCECAETRPAGRAPRARRSGRAG